MIISDELKKIEDQLEELRSWWRSTQSSTMKHYYETRAKMLKEKRERLKNEKI